MNELKHFILLLNLSLLVAFISCSDGDRSPFYQKCLGKCINNDCTTDGGFTSEAARAQDAGARLLGWRCEDDCRYRCMWRTVDGYTQRGYEIPKFHGKWPFRRILGVQEPASAFASVLNLLAHVHMYRQIVREFSIKDTPLLIFWHCFAWVCMNAWLWSAVFHARDVYLTELMDYAGALSMVMSLLVAAIVRILHRRRGVALALSALLAVYYVEHVRYLHAGRVDYEYNMWVNVLFGVAGSVLWLGWSCAEWWAGRTHARHLVAFTLLSGGFLTMELWDFAPRRGWDAHALWHLSTALLPPLFYRFVIDDLRHLRQLKVKSGLKLP